MHTIRPSIHYQPCIPLHLSTYLFIYLLSNLTGCTFCCLNISKSFALRQHYSLLSLHSLISPMCHICWMFYFVWLKYHILMWFITGILHVVLSLSCAECGDAYEWLCRLADPWYSKGHQPSAPQGEGPNGWAFYEGGKEQKTSIAGKPAQGQQFTIFNQPEPITATLKTLTW